MRKDPDVPFDGTPGPEPTVGLIPYPVLRGMPQARRRNPGIERVWFAVPQSGDRWKGELP